jgi:hypothetical protein
VLRLKDGAGTTFAIRAEQVTRRPGDSRPLMTNVSVTTDKPDKVRPLRYECARAEIIARPLLEAGIVIELRLIRRDERPVLEYNPRARDYSRPLEKDTLSLDGLMMPDRIVAEWKALTPQQVLDMDDDIPVLRPYEDQRIGFARTMSAFRRKVHALIHYRTAFSLSMLVTVVLGATLGVVFRGSRALVAFLVAFIPFGIVAIALVRGRQVAESEGGELLGLSIIWGTLLAVAIADGLVMRFGVRR